MEENKEKEGNFNNNNFQPKKKKNLVIKKHKEEKEKINIEIKEEKNNENKKEINKTNLKENNKNTQKKQSKNYNNKQKNNNNLEKNNSKSQIKVIALGGLEEIGKNITVFEYDDEMIVIDCGISFPEDDMLGIDVVIPDFTYLIQNKHRIKGVFITHGHEDHIGAIPYLLKEINVPIYATAFTLGLIKIKLEEHKLLKTAKLNLVNAGEIINAGKMSVEFIASSHSIPDSCMLAISSPVGVMLHTGDYKIDLTPVDNKRIDLGRIAELGNKGVLALFSDSTNSERQGFNISEKTVGNTFEKFFESSKQKRIIVATFASNVHRVQQLVNLAIKYDRKIAVSGRSMENMLKVVKELNYFDVPDEIFIPMDLINTVTDDKLLIITTGSQGESMSALTRIARGQHSKIKLTPNDLVIISATPIPGNEASVTKVIDDIIKRKVEVVYSDLEHVHVSGHACKEEQKFIMALAKPKFFVPVHGYVRQIHAQSNTALEMGIPKENIVVLDNGTPVLFTKDSFEKSKEKVKTGKVFVDGLGVGDVGNVILRDRQHLAQDGLIMAIITIDSRKGELLQHPEIITRGFVYVKESEELVDNLKNIIKEEVEKNINDWDEIKQNVRKSLTKYIFKKTGRDPMIIPFIVEI